MPFGFHMDHAALRALLKPSEGSSNAGRQGRYTTPLSQLDTTPPSQLNLNRRCVAAVSTQPIPL